MIRIRPFIALLILTALIALYIGHLIADGTAAPEVTPVTIQNEAGVASLTDHTFYWFTNHDKGWERVSREDADTLAESGLRNADKRHWEHCVTNGIAIFCPGGYAARWDNNAQLWK
jgi:hypothetical protein